MGALDENKTIPPSAEAWDNWLTLEEGRTRAVYLGKPASLIADYRREQAVSRDYEGREILELLQNANDQAADAGQPGRVRIELSDDGLVVANSGAPFSTGGVESLQNSHLSPKRHSQRQFIGNKGLGFRSILNWSSAPMVLSGALRLAYSPTVSAKILGELLQESTELSERVSNEKGGSDDLVIPLLPFPGHSRSGDLSSIVVRDESRRILNRCEALIGGDFTTAIGMPFGRSNAKAAAQSQLASLRPEILLFAEHLGELTFGPPSGETQTWTRHESDGITRVLSGDKVIGSWRVFRKKDELPASVRDADQRQSLDYELVIAVPTKGTDSPSVLFSYFPTDIGMPLPVVCHATIELEQNRKHAQLRPSNQFVFDRLAEFLAEVAEKVAADQTDDPWAGCSILMHGASYPRDLESVGFPAKLLEAAGARRIVPTLQHGPAVPTNALLLAGASADWLPPSIFPETAPVRGLADSRFFESLAVPELDAEIFSKRLLEHPNLPLDTRVALIVGILRSKLPSEFHVPGLMVDSDEKVVQDGTRLFLAPASGEIPALPTWMELRFLNEPVRSELAIRLEARDNRDLQGKLQHFGVAEYSFGSIVSALVATANRRIRSEPDLALSRSRELLHALFDLYLAEGSGSRHRDFPDRSALSLPNQRGSLESADNLYLGRGYGAQGEVIQDLYEAWAPEKLLGTPSDLGLVADAEQLRAFLTWLGVAPWPRETRTRAPDEFLEHVLHKISYPAAFEDKVVPNPAKAYSARVTNARAIDELERILATANPTAIVAWLSLDIRALDWQRPALGHGNLEAFPDGVYRARSYSGVIPNLIKFEIERQAWLPTSTGKKLGPRDCVLGERVVEVLFPHPAMPESSELSRLGVTRDDVFEGWRRAGVIASLRHLSRDDIYAKLLELPERQVSGREARSLYQWLLGEFDATVSDSGPYRTEFLARGKMWGKHGDSEGYFPIRELRHADSEGLPDELLRRLRVVDLPKRVGADKVTAIFGVTPVQRAGVVPRAVSRQLAVGSTEADANLQSAKPYLLKLRAAQAGQIQYLKTLNHIRLEVCSTFVAEITYEGEAFQYEVPVWGWLLENDVIYVRADPAEPIAFSDDLLADAVGDALASLFRLVDGGDFARMLRCDPKNRRSLLRRMRGESADEDMESIIAQFDGGLRRPPPATQFPLEPPVPVVDPLPALTAPPQELAATPTPADGTHTAPSPPQPLTIRPEPHEPQLPTTAQKLRIRTVTSSSHLYVSSHRVTDGDFCERKVLEFEYCDNPPRFPLLVSQITGSEAPRCDILSFSSAEDRGAFTTQFDYALVNRFIEVKGRGDPGATIELKGNELSNAEANGDRYFLYRLYEDSNGDFVLTILQNPLSDKAALQPVVIVSLEKSERASRFSLSGGVTRNSPISHSQDPPSEAAGTK